MTGNGKDCRTLDIEMRYKHRQVKEFNEMCAITERKCLTDKVNRHSRIRKITGQRICSSASCIKSRTEH